MRKVFVAFLSMIVLASFSHAAPKKKKQTKPLPNPTFEAVAYGEHSRQIMDVWLPEKKSEKFPVVVYIHGGGFTSGSYKDSRLADRIPKCRERGIAQISVEYRLLKDIADEKPPVKGCLDDVFAAIRFIRSKAEEWNLDISRIGLTGGSAGACASLIASLTEDNIFGIKAVYMQYPQTSLDPKEMREWIPNSKYGANLFGYKNFQEWLNNREECLEWIEKFSPAGLLRKCTASKAPVFFFSGPKAPPPGELAKDPTHSGTFNDKFKEIAQSKGISCKHGNHMNLLSALKPNKK
jgi:acetyl esterase/lipase